MEKGGERGEILKDDSITAISEIGKKRKPAGNEKVVSTVDIEVELGVERIVKTEFEVEEKIEFEVEGKIEFDVDKSREKNNSGDDVASN